MKFKVGDKVRVIGNSWEENTHFFDIGVVCEIKRYYETDNSYLVVGRGLGQCVLEGDLELVKDDTQGKHHRPIVYKVYEEMKRHIGVDNAISATEICLFCGLSGHRELRKIMREIRRSGELEKIPCSCNKGYYMASTKEEAKKSIDRLVNTAKNELKTAYTMANKLGLEGQMKMQFGKYFKDTYHSLMEDKEDVE